MKTENMTKNEKQRQKWIYILELEKLMDSLDLCSSGVLVVQTMMVVREFVGGLTEDQIKQLVSADPTDLIRLAGTKGLEGDLIPVPKSEAVNRVDHNGQYRDYSGIEKDIMRLTADEPQFQ